MISNEHPVGLATIVGLAPALVALIVFVVLVIVNRGDVDKAQQLTMSIIAAASLIGTSALRQWRAAQGSPSGPAESPAPTVADPVIEDEGDAQSAPQD